MDLKLTLLELVKMLAMYLILVDHQFHMDQEKSCINSLFQPRYPTSNHSLCIAHKNLKIHLLLNRQAPKCSWFKIPHLGHLVNFKLESISTNLELSKFHKEISNNNRLMYNKDLYQKPFSSKENPCNKNLPLHQQG